MLTSRWNTQVGMLLLYRGALIFDGTPDAAFANPERLEQVSLVPPLTMQLQRSYNDTPSSSHEKSFSSQSLAAWSFYSDSPNCPVCVFSRKPLPPSINPTVMASNPFAYPLYRIRNMGIDLQPSDFL